MPTRIVLDKLRAGVFIDKVKTNKCKIKVVSKLDKNSWLEVQLKEGRNRQIRKMFEAVGHEAVRIIRTAFGPLELGTLPIGVYRFLNKVEIETIKSIENKLKKTPAPKTVRKIYKSKVT